MEDIMEILERKKTELYFVGVKVDIKDGLDVTDTYILFENSDDADKVFAVLSNHDAFDGEYNFVGKTNPNTIRVRGEIVVRCLRDNTLSVSVYNDWRML
jgi:hypothetical protein